MQAMRTVVACLGLMLLLLSAAAFADESDPIAGQVYLSFEPDGRVQDLEVAPLIPFEFYLIVDLDLAGGDPSQFLGIEGKLTFSDEIFLSQIDWAGTGQWLVTGGGVIPGSFDFVAATSPCIGLADGPNVICTFRGVLLSAASDLFVGVGPGTTGDPGWATCGLLHYFFEPDGFPRELSINSPTAVESESWGRIKAMYQN